MRSMNVALGTVVLCCLLTDVQLYSGSFGSTFRSGLFPTSQDEEELWEEERDTEGEDRIIAKLAQIIREINTKYAPQPPPPPQAYPPVAVPDFTYHFPEFDLGSIVRSSIPFAVRPNDPLYHQTDFSSNSKKQIFGAFGETPSAGDARGSNSRTPRPKFLKPMMILVKDDNDDEEKDDTPDHSAMPHLSPVANLHKGHPKFGYDHDTKEVEYDREGHRPDTQVYITKEDGFDEDNMYFIALVAGCSAALLLVISVGVYSWYKLQRNSKLEADVKYPAYSVGGVTKNGTPPSSGDRRLAHSAQMYHYQHQKQQILALEHNNRDHRRGSLSDGDSDEDNDVDHTVYECPTLPLTNKKTPDIEVKKPTVENKPTPSLPSSNTSEDTDKPNQQN